MKHGELIMRKISGDILYWFSLLPLCFLLSKVLAKQLEREALTLSLLGLLAVMVAVRLTLLQSWNISRLAWRIDESALMIGEYCIPLSSIRSVELHEELANKNSWVLIIRAGRVLRFCSVVLGPERAASLCSFRLLAEQLDTAAEYTKSDKM